MSSYQGPSDGAVINENEATQQVVTDAVRQLWTVANSLARIQPADRTAFSVTVFGSARLKPEHALYKEVRRMTKQLSAQGCDIVTGGGPGLMQAANEGAQQGDPDNRTRSIGIGIELPFEAGANPFVEQAYQHETFFTRLHQFVRLSHAFVVVGGGIGTALEAFMVWQLLQVKHIHSVPLIMVGEMWQGLVTWAKTNMLSFEPPLASEEDLQIPICVNNVDEALAALAPHIDNFEHHVSDDSTSNAKHP